MTVLNTISKVTGNGNGSGTRFPFTPIQIFDASEVELYITETATGTTTQVTHGSGPTDFNVDISLEPNQSASGSVIYPADEVTPLPSGWSYSILRKVPLLQQVEVENQGGYNPEVQEQIFDRATMGLLQIQEQVERSVKIGVGDNTDPADLVSSLVEASATAAAASITATAAEVSASSSAAASAASATESATSVGGVRVSPDDTTPSNLEDKLLVGSGLSLSTQNDGADETRTIDLDISGVAVGVPLLTDTAIFTDISDANATKKATISDILGLASGGGWVPIQTQTVTTAVASVDFTSGIDATYKTYVVVFNEVTVSSSSSLNFRLSTDAGATFISSSNYSTGRQNQDTQATTYSQSNQNNISQFLGANVGNDATDLSNGIVYFFGMGVSGIPSLLYDVIAEQDAATANSYKYSGFGTYKSNILPNGIRFYVGSTFTAGTFTLYGLAGA
mgnify:CR=1 FL=1